MRSFWGKKKLLNGQTIKTKLLNKELNIAIGSNNIQIVDTHGWKRNPYKLILECIKLHKHCENIVILPARNGLRIFGPLFSILNYFFHRKLHYVVIGGWLPELIKNKYILKWHLKRFEGIYVETQGMLKSLQQIGFNNVICLPNFKRLNIVEESEISYTTQEPYKLCTFSRVMKEKGIEDAIYAVKKANEFYNRIVYTLDIYGQIDDGYKNSFQIVLNNCPSYIKYKGTVNYEDSVDVIKDYFALLFPTYYEGEGFAGTILDAYASGVPVISTNWKYNGEVIRHEVDGILYDYSDEKALFEILLKVKKNPYIINSLKKNCLKRAKQYSPEIVIKRFIENI
ncbi:glycosyltransferase family 4 protein [Natronospora cellulosivora (SeqCode)]